MQVQDRRGRAGLASARHRGSVAV